MTREAPCLGCDAPVTQELEADGFFRPPLCPRCQVARDADAEAAAELAAQDAADIVAYDEFLDASA
jgi:hypothetical protein